MQIGVFPFRDQYAALMYNLVATSLLSFLLFATVGTAQNSPAPTRIGTRPRTPSEAAARVTEEFENQYRTGDFESQARAYKTRKLLANRYLRLFNPKDVRGEELLGLADLYTYAERYANAEKTLTAYLQAPDVKEIVRAQKNLLSILVARRKFQEAYSSADHLLDEPQYDRELITRVQSLIDMLQTIEPLNAGNLSAKMLPKLFQYVSESKENSFLSMAPMLEAAFENGMIFRSLGQPERSEAYARDFLTRFNSSPVSSEERVRHIIQFADRRIKLIGQQPPELTGTAYIDMSKIPMSFLSGKVIMLDFLAHWCVQCIADLPYTDLLQNKYKAKGLVVIGITEFYGYFGDRENLTAEEELTALKELKSQRKARIGLVVGPKSNREAYGVSGYPAVAVIDRSGKVRYLKQGADYRRYVESVIRELLSEGRKSAEVGK